MGMISSMKNFISLKNLKRFGLYVLIGELSLGLTVLAVTEQISAGNTGLAFFTAALSLLLGLVYSGVIAMSVVVIQHGMENDRSKSDS